MNKILTNVKFIIWHTCSILFKNYSTLWDIAGETASTCL